MKSGKDEAKHIGPLFSSLNSISDADKGGQMPTSRNKMALWQRYDAPSENPGFNSGSMKMLPVRASNDHTSFATQPSSSQKKVLPAFLSLSGSSNYLIHKYNLSRCEDEIDYKNMSKDPKLGHSNKLANIGTIKNRSGDRDSGSLQVENVDKKQEISHNTTAADSVSVLDLCPDDVVGVIGEKQFWKTRNTILRQQRTFAMQIFELHRLIKVQRFIARSPQVLHENNFSPPTIGIAGQMDMISTCQNSMATFVDCIRVGAMWRGRMSRVDKVIKVVPRDPKSASESASSDIPVYTRRNK